MAAYLAKPPNGSQLQRGHRDAKGLVAAYLFTEGNGLRAADSVGRAHGVLTGLPTWSKGAFGRCVLFDGSGDYINTPPVVSGTALSLAAWINVTATSATANVIYGGTTSTANNALILRLTATRLQLFSNEASSVGQSIAITYSAGTWIHVAATISGLTTKLYLNGVDVSSTNNTATLFATYLTNTIGRDPANNWTFNGAIDHLYVWNRVISANQVNRIYRDPYSMFRRRQTLKAASTFQAAWARGSNAILVPGVLA